MYGCTLVRLYFCAIEVVFSGQLRRSSMAFLLGHGAITSFALVLQFLDSETR